MSYLGTFINQLRLSNPWNYKVPMLMAFTYFFLLSGGVSSWQALMSICAALITVVGFAGVGYTTNDLSDAEDDRAAGKSNAALRYGKTKLRIALIVFLILALIPWVYLPIDRVSIGLIIAELALFFFYAFPPIRLKERGASGVFTDALYAHVLPALLASWTFHLVSGKRYEHFAYFLLIVGCWQLISGVRNILHHQIKDVENDRIAGVRTFAVGMRIAELESVIKWVLIPLEMLAFIAFVVLLSFELNWAIIAVGIYWMVTIVQFAKRTPSHEPSYKQFANLFLDRCYLEWIPAIILIGLIISPLIVFPIVIVHAVLFVNPLKSGGRWLNHHVMSLPIIHTFGELSELKKGVIHVVLLIATYTALLLYICMQIKHWNLE